MLTQLFKTESRSKNETFDTSKMKIKQSIFTTNDYSRFSFKKDNRKIKDCHITKLTKSIKIHGQQDLIKVNPKGQIQDGQHKFTVLKQLNMPINFYVMDDADVDMIVLNTDRRNWQLHDYLNYYVQNDVSDYIRINNICENFSMFSVPGVIKALGLSNKDFKVNKINLLTTNVTTGVEILKACKDLDWFSQNKATSFVSAIAKTNRMHKQFNVKIFFEKCELYKSAKIYRCTSEEEFRNMINSLWNFKSRNKINN